MAKWALFLAVVITLTPLHADEDKKKENFSKVKAEALANLDKRIKHLQDTKSCVSSSSDRKALKECRQTARERGEALRSEFKEKRKAMKEQVMQRRKERQEKKKGSK